MALADRLSEYVISMERSAIDARALEEAKKRFIDAVGCGLGAYGEGPISMARRAAVRVTAERGATLLGTQRVSSPDYAAFVNGFMMRYFDFNDTYLSKEPAHPSDNFGACLAVAEAEGVSGREMLEAGVLAYEVQCRLCDAADLRHRGWDHVNYGLVSTALSSARLMGLSVDEGAQAVNIALNGHVAMRQVRAGELSMWKGASFANAARNGVFAATLAREGVEGPSPIFEGEMGFFKQVSGPFRLRIGGFGGRRGEFKVKSTYIKFFPAEYHAQTAVWAALSLRKGIVSLKDVESILIETHEAGYTILGKDPEKWRPRTKETADHSLPFMVASAIADGKLDNASYGKDRLSDPRLLSLMDKTTVREDERFTALYPNRGMANRITVRLKGGKELVEEEVVPRGHPANPMSQEEVDAKFLKLAGAALGPRKARTALGTLKEVESADLHELMAAIHA